MQKNMGIVDRVIRLALAVIIGILYFSNQISGTAALILGIIAIVFLLTSIVSFCPLYNLLKINTIGKSTGKKGE
ncbi:DUF2892 domain-containing protein [Marispirochaeta sp.]|jgi:hypothetical protein|uniref:YgaP family membrane protein n=1 Tax=Marispirochaeta sp. TaxID=2038653 RepID=UPI0029C6EC3B|nr:DUF2892 domain-containing protein [Marispirochaeta sp.]